MGKKRQLQLKKKPNYQAKYEEFIKNTFPRDRFTVENVAEDNACFYRAISNGLCYITDTPDDSSEVVLDFIGIWKDKQNMTPIDRQKWGYRGSEQSRTARIIQQLARKWVVQNRNSEIKSIPGYRVIDMLRDIHDVNFTTNDASLNTSLQNDDFIVALYDSCYSNFAANRRKLTVKTIESNEDANWNDDNYEDMDDEPLCNPNKCIIMDSDDEINIENINNNETIGEDVNPADFEVDSDYDEDTDDNIDGVTFNNDYISELLEKDKTITNDSTYMELKKSIQESSILNKFDRWGSSLEAYALSELFKIPIIVYAPKKFNHQTGVVETGRLIQGVMPEKKVRFEVMQKWGDEYSQTAPPVELLYKGRTKTKKSADHYMALYQKYT